ncbi:hypothetical protein [Corallococcus macrosporus]|uniref:Lipoprotein n=1 Tax=Myxococcus fulvus (strain ATCC BAA-855 / HW-1) TaxID=483219 RepID=F8CNI3_MYXFH|nr:hypothetical protein [Corallococcus macrosporus]AEI62900.1 hypothetical protein LILAB_04895 [Corallococcus macrosporus]
MRRAVLLALGVAVAALACKTTQPPGAEEQQPLMGPDQIREPVQTVPDSPAGPATPLPETDAGTPESQTAPESQPE